MKPFLSDSFLLQTPTAEKLYFDWVEELPIYDYHCHLPVREIAENHRFENLTRIWLYGDHYKWRAMRANGIDEELITGSASDREKFLAWAGTVPMTVRNPLYHWTHLELKRTFGITDKLLNEETADEIYDECNEQLKTDENSVHGLLEKMNVAVICTTDDPLDDLEHHQQLAKDPSLKTEVFPAFRPDKGLKIDNPDQFNQWVDQLASLTGADPESYDSYLEALEKRVELFHQVGCRISDQGIDDFAFVTGNHSDVKNIFKKARKNETLSQSEVIRFRSAVLLELGRMYADRDWTQQFHIGPIRNTNSRMFERLGPDTGFDSMGDLNYAKPLADFLDHLDRGGKLARTILYTINPKDNEMLATMTGNFQDGSVAGKIQFGSGWWFNDQKDGIERQLNALSQMGLISRFVGMLTDSRSFMSFPRHEYFRRILCNLFGNDIENGELPNDPKLIGGILRDICYDNAQRYFRLT